MVRRRVFAGVALAAAFAVGMVGCSGKVQLSMQKHCDSVGGKWNQSDETCQVGPGAAKQAKQICQSNGGIYLPGGMCEYEGSK